MTTTASACAASSSRPTSTNSLQARSGASYQHRVPDERVAVGLDTPFWPIHSEVSLRAARAHYIPGDDFLYLPSQNCDHGPPVGPARQHLPAMELHASVVTRHSNRAQPGPGQPDPDGHLPGRVRAILPGVPLPSPRDQTAARERRVCQAPSQQSCPASRRLHAWSIRHSCRWYFQRPAGRDLQRLRRSSPSTRSGPLSCSPPPFGRPRRDSPSRSCGWGSASSASTCRTDLQPLFRTDRGSPDRPRHPVHRGSRAPFDSETGLPGAH